MVLSDQFLESRNAPAVMNLGLGCPNADACREQGPSLDSGSGPDPNHAGQVDSPESSGKNCESSGVRDLVKAVSTNYQQTVD